MKTDKKRVQILLGFLILISFVLIVFGLLNLRYKKQADLRIRSALYDEIDILPYIDQDEFSFFIPSGMNYDDLFIFSSKIVYCNGKKINNSPLSSFVSEEDNTYTIDGKDCKISYYRSDDVPSIFIETARMDMDYVNSEKGNSVDISAFLIDKEGNKKEIRPKGTLKGRGNNSWDTPKKSYSLSFDDAVSLLDMNEAKKWILIPNSTDNSKVYNKTVYSFARDTGLEWTPDSRYLSVYFDGKYNGLYLLSEKIEVDSSRLDIGKDSLLLKRELPMRIDIVDNGFLTDHGNVIEITYPKEVSVYHKELIEKEVQKMEDAIFDLNSNDWMDLIDLDSWVRSYLIDELFDNLDAGIASANFYLKDGVFYRGPVWDYDSIMMDNPKAMIADTYFRQPYSTNDYYYYLNQRNEFKSRAKELFEIEFRPLIQEYTESKIDMISDQIRFARETDCARWNYVFTQSSITVFKDYLRQKADFMEEYWENEDKYCKVLIQYEIFYKTFMVEKGLSVENALNIDMTLFEKNEYQNAETGETFDITQPILEDIRLDLISEKVEIEEEKSFVSEFGVMNLAFSGLFALLLLYMVIKEIYINV